MSHSSSSLQTNPNRTKFERLVYFIQTKLGIHPKWETDLIQTDDKLKMYKKLKDNGICSTLYDLRINYLKGWIQKL